MPVTTTPQLFQPIEVGLVKLSHRIVLPPLTRMRCTKSTHLPIIPLVKEYYAQRARLPGSFLITECIFIAPQAAGANNMPGIWNDEQIDAWKQISDVVHEQGSYIFMQVAAFGRIADPSILASHDPPLSLVGPSPIPVSSQPDTVPHPLTIEEISEYVDLFARAAHNAVHRAGFDGVEIHGANGWLPDQFLQDVSNVRTDHYGGGVEGRSRFILEVVDAIARAVGPERTALRLSPWSTSQDMSMADPVPQFTHLVTALRDAHPSLAYLHIIEPRVVGDGDREHAAHESNDFLRAIWKPRPYISAGGHTAETAAAAAERGSELVAFGRYYVSNPDLPLKLKNNLPLTAYDRSTFYTPGHLDLAHVGYIDYPVGGENIGIGVKTRV